MHLKGSIESSKYRPFSAMGLGMKLGVTEGHDVLRLPDSAVTTWPLAHASQD